MTPIPTPYDITAIPFFAYVPSLSEWLIFILACAIAVAAISWLLGREGGRGSRLDACTVCLSELLEVNSQCGDVLTREQVSKISLVLKRLLARFSGLDLAQCSPRELHLLKPKLAEKGMLPILDRAVVLGEIIYQPEGMAFPPRSLVQDIFAEVEALQSNLKLRNK